jgi:LPXTG-site transpeptidase (sortase) family protein
VPQPELDPSPSLISRLTRWWAVQPVSTRVTAVGGIAIMLIAVVGVASLLLTLGGDGAGVTVRSSRGARIVQPVAGSGLKGRLASASRDAADEEDRPQSNVDPKTRLPLVRTLEGMRQYGDPPGAGFARLKIPSQNVNATVVARVVGPDGHMPNPAGPAEAVWYDLSAWGLGGAPGGGGNAVFSAHVDFADVVPFANVRYQGVGVFFNLGRLQQGDIVEVEYKGQTLRYAVEWRKQVAGEGDWNALLAAGSRDSITLITCSGDFDISTRSYDSRTVVRAVRL